MILMILLVTEEGPRQGVPSTLAAVGHCCWMDGWLGVHRRSRRRPRRETRLSYSLQPDHIIQYNLALNTAQDQTSRAEQSRAAHNVALW